MREMMRPLALIALLLMLMTADAAARPGKFRGRVHPMVRVWLSSPELRKQVEPIAPAKVQAPVSIRFRSPPSPGALSRLEAEGIRFIPSDGARGDRGILHLGLFYPALTNAKGVEALERCPLVHQVDLDLLLQDAVPLHVTAKEIGAHDVWPTEKQGVPLTGKGMTAGIIDSGVDVNHPAMFRADGALHAWLDTNHNGLFDAGVDAVDLDNDGQAGAKETLRFFDAVVWSYWSTAMLGSKNGKFDPDQDWLYADQNANSRRDYGTKDGFDDKTPTFGEPLFVAEDLNNNHKLDPEEKVRALGSSKIAATTYNGLQRLRGTDLSLTDNESRGSHGMATAGVLAGGQRGYHKWVGVAPDADLLMAFTSTTQSVPLSSLIIWLSKAKADLILHEYAPWVGYHMDGSSNHESLMDQAAQLGMAQVTPAGNLGGAKKHMRQTIKAGATGDVHFNIPPSSGGRTYYYLRQTFLWRDITANLEFTLKDPGVHSQVLATDNTSGIPWDGGKSTLYSYRYDSSRGTAKMDVILYSGTSTSPKALTKGDWRLSVKHPGTSGQVLLLGYVSDNASGWGKGIAFTKDISEMGLVCFPATADSAISLGAYAGHSGFPYEVTPGKEKAGELRGYSGRGVRVDGVQIMDLAAPDNPVSPFNEIANKSSLGAFRIFGGTSGAGPHVAGAALLVKQHTPTLDGLKIRAALRQGALADSQVGAVPSYKWGYGKLRIYPAIYGKDPPLNTTPTAQIVTDANAYVGHPLILQPKVQDNQDSQDKLQIRWDEGYDGTYDTAFGPVKPLTRTFTSQGTFRLKLQVKDTGGLTAAAAVLVKILPASQKPDSSPVALDAGPPGADAPLEDDGCDCRVHGADPHQGQTGPVLLLALVLVFGWLRRLFAH